MSGLLNKFLSFAGLEAEEEEELYEQEEKISGGFKNDLRSELSNNSRNEARFEGRMGSGETRSESHGSGLRERFSAGYGKKSGKVVNIHNTTSTQFRMVIVQPESYDDAQEICDHIKNNQPVVVNLDCLEKDCAQRIIDFISGAIYSLDGNIQKVSNVIFVLAPSNVDLDGDFREELKGKGVFPWIK